MAEDGTNDRVQVGEDRGVRVVDPLVDLSGLPGVGASEVAGADGGEVAGDGSGLNEVALGGLEHGGLAGEGLGLPLFGLEVLRGHEDLLDLDASEVGSNKCNINPQVALSPVVDLHLYLVAYYLIMISAPT